MTELLLAGVGVSLFIQLGKVLTSKITDKTVAKNVVLATGFVLSLAVALVLRFTPEHIIVEGSAIFTSAIAAYEVLYKRMIEPALRAAGLTE